MRVCIGISRSPDHLRAAKEAAETAKAGMGKGIIDFALVLSTPEFAHRLTLDTVLDLLGPVPLFGASSIALISNQGLIKHGIAVAAFKIPEGAYFNAACVKEENHKNALKAGEELGDKLLYGCRDVRRNLSLIFCASGPALSGEIIAGAQERLGTGFPLIGASITDKNNATRIYFNREILSAAACGILWGGKLNFSLGTSHGYEPLGKEHRVTSSAGNIVREIDGAPAINFYKEYFNKDTPGIIAEADRLSALYPLGIREPEEEQCLLRSIASLNPDGTIAFNGNMPEESRIRLMINSREACLASARKAARAAIENTRGHEAKFAFALDSLARHKLLGRAPEEEIEIIKTELGEKTPLLGLYTAAEQAPLSAVHYLGKIYLQNNSLAILTMRD